MSLILLRLRPNRCHGGPGRSVGLHKRQAHSATKSPLPLSFLFFFCDQLRNFQKTSPGSSTELGRTKLISLLYYKRNRSSYMQDSMRVADDVDPRWESVNCNQLHNCIHQRCTHLVLNARIQNSFGMACIPVGYILASHVFAEKFWKWFLDIYYNVLKKLYIFKIVFHFPGSKSNLLNVLGIFS